MSKVIDIDITSLSAKRESIYTFLRIALNEPLSMETLSHWKESLSLEFLNVLTDDNENLQAFFYELKNKEIADIFDREKEAYLATFDIMNKDGRVAAPPWESVYVTQDQALFGEPVLQIRKKLTQFGMKFIKENKEPEDHISIELEFMSFLINYTSQALKSQNEYDYERGVYNQYWLLKEHLNRWIELFAQNVHSSDTTPFYKGIAELLCLFVAEDFEYIKSLKEELENE